MGRGGWRSSLFLAAALGCVGPADAHEGPPYPVIVDQTIGPFLVSVWADPDVGTGTFFVYLEPPDDAAKMPAENRVRVFVQPADRRIPEAGYDAVLQPRRAGRRLLVAEVPFETQERWRTRFVIDSERGGGETETEVEVTPPGSQGPLIDFMMFLFPFLAVGFLFFKAIMRRRAVTTEATP